MPLWIEIIVAKDWALATEDLWLDPEFHFLLDVILKGWDHFLSLDLSFLVSRIWIITVSTSWNETHDVSKGVNWGRISPSSSSPLLSRSLLCFVIPRRNLSKELSSPQNKSERHGIFKVKIYYYVPLMFQKYWDLVSVSQECSGQEKAWILLFLMLALWSSASNFASLSLSFPLCKIGISVLPPLGGYCENMKWCLNSLSSTVAHRKCLVHLSCHHYYWEIRWIYISKLF